jgi:DNA-binding NarL/FixJ family response regulator
MLSAYDDATLRHDALEAGACAYLVKGASLAELVDALGG